MSIDEEKLNALASSRTKPLRFEKKLEEWAKVIEAESWIRETKDRFSIKAVIEALQNNGVNLSYRSLRPAISNIRAGGSIDDKPDRKPHGRQSKSVSVAKNKSDTEVEKAQPVSDPDVDKGGKESARDTRPAWIIREEQKKLKKQQEEEEELRLRPWKDQSLPMEERQRLQEEYITQNVDTVFKLKK